MAVPGGPSHSKSGAYLSCQCRKMRTHFRLQKAINLELQLYHALGNEYKIPIFIRTFV